MSLQRRLILLFLTLGLTPFLIVGVMSYRTASTSLEKANFKEVQMVRNILKDNLERFLKNRLADVRVFNSNTAVVEAARRFTAAAESEEGINGPTWQQWEQRYGPKFVEITEFYEYHDLMIMSLAGTVVYSVEKEADFGKNINSPTLRNTSLVEAFEKGKNDNSFTDVEIYGPSGMPEAFFSGPIKDNAGNVVGVLILELAISSVNNIMESGADLEENLETYLVGQDYLMRSNSFLDTENRSVDASFRENNRVQTTATEAALSGETDEQMVTDYRGQQVLSAYAPIDFQGTRWAILSEIDRDVAFREIYRLRTAMIILGVVIAVLIVLIGWFFARTISQPINDVVNTLSSSSSEIASTAAQQERTASQQSSSVNETTTTMDELGASSRQSSEQAQAATNGAEEALQAAKHGTDIVDQSVHGMEELKDRVEDVANQILQLSEQISQIGDITNLVSDIANQTNLLALNAAVEAARAGEHGKGFAVVATEIRKLADESKQSAERINDLVQRIQKATNQTVMVTEESTKTVDRNMANAEMTSESFKQVSQSVGLTYDNVQQIAMNIQQQAAAVSQVVEAMNTLNHGAKETAAGLKQTRTGLQNLDGAAKRLQKLISG